MSASFNVLTVILKKYQGLTKAIKFMWGTLACCVTGLSTVRLGCLKGKLEVTPLACETSMLIIMEGQLLVLTEFHVVNHRQNLLDIRAWKSGTIVCTCT